MTVKTLKDLYLEQLRDLYSACKQTMPVVTEMGRAARSRDLCDALIAANQGIAQGIEVMGQICTRHEMDPVGQAGKGIDALILDIRKNAVETDFPDDDIQNVAIVAHFQRLAYYTIAGYGSLVGLANPLGLEADGTGLQDCLDRTWQTIRRMSAIADEAAIRISATN